MRAPHAGQRPTRTSMRARNPRSAHTPRATRPPHTLRMPTGFLYASAPPSVPMSTAPPSVAMLVSRALDFTGRHGEDAGSSWIQFVSASSGEVCAQSRRTHRTKRVWSRTNTWRHVALPAAGRPRVSSSSVSARRLFLGPPKSLHLPQTPRTAPRHNRAPPHTAHRAAAVSALYLPSVRITECIRSPCGRAWHA